jgi:hypothetical protein
MNHYGGPVRKNGGLTNNQTIALSLAAAASIMMRHFSADL